MTFGGYSATFLQYSFKPYGESNSSHPAISDKTLTWAASVGAGFINGLSRISFATLADKYSFRTLMSALQLIELVVALTFYWAAYVPSLYFTCILLNYVAMGGFYAIFPVSVTSVFGLTYGPQIYVQILFGSFCASLWDLGMTRWVLPETSFSFMFYFGAGVTLVTLAIVYFFKEQLDSENLAKWNALEPVKKVRSKSKNERKN